METDKFRCMKNGCHIGPCVIEVKQGITPFICPNFSNQQADWVPLTDDTQQLEDSDTPTVAEEAVEEPPTESPEQSPQTDEYRYEVFQGFAVPKLRRPDELFKGPADINDFIECPRCGSLAVDCIGIQCTDCLFYADSEKRADARKLWAYTKGFISLSTDTENSEEAAEDKPVEEQPQLQPAEPADTETVVDKPMYEEFRGYFIPHVTNKEHFDAELTRRGMYFVRAPYCGTIGVQCGGLACERCLFSSCNQDSDLILARHQWMLENGYINEPVSEVSQESTEERVSDPVVRDIDDLERLSAPVEDIHRELGPNATRFDWYRALMAKDIDKEALCAWIALAAEGV